MSELDPTYDEAHIKTILETVPLGRRVAFACAMAERLMPTAVWLESSTNRGGAAPLRAALDLAWDVADGRSADGDQIERARETAESLVPDDEDEDWTLLSPLAQNAAAAVAYALRTCPAGDVQEATWAARQVHEAADYLVQLVEADQTYAAGSDTTAEPMSIALRGITTALASIGSAGIDQLRADAAADGARFVGLLDTQQ